MKSYYPRFVCPECSCERAVEVRRSVRKSIAAIFEDEKHRINIIYDSEICPNEPDHVEFRCRGCDYVVQDKGGRIAHEDYEFCDWLTEQAEARIARIEFTCPSCGGHQLDDNVEIDDEGDCQRIFCCRGCGEEVCDEEEDILRQVIEWGRKYSCPPIRP